MLLLFIVVVATLVAGHAGSEALWAWQGRRSGVAVDALIGPVERMCSSALTGVFVLLAINWLLALTRTLYAAPLVVLSALSGVAGGWWLARAWRGVKPAELPRRKSLFVVALFTPLIAFVVYVLWRSSVLPVLAHDGLNYHMPKAALLVREHGYTYFPNPNSRIPYFPFDYEILAADVILLTGSDAVTEWVSTSTFILFAIASGALTERWWGRGLHVVGGVLVMASMPVVVLHAGAHKNDLMACALMIAGSMWTARAVRREEAVPGILAFLSFTACAGTKFQGAAELAWAVVVALGFAFRRRRDILAGATKRTYAIVLAGALVAVVLLGLVPYAANVLRTGRPTGITSESVQFKGFWDFKAFAWFLYMGLALPLSPRMDTVWIPWRDQDWWWPSNDHMFSHFGLIVTILVLLLPIGVWRYRKKVASPGEPSIVATVMLPVSVTFLLLKLHPFGMFNTSLRWVSHVPAVVIGWTLVPFLRELFAAGAKKSVAAYAMLSALGIGSAAYQWKYARDDSYIPTGYLTYLLGDGAGSRLAPTSPVRAEYRIDEWARPNDTIAVDGDFSTYIYPAYGEKLTRKIVYVPEGDGPPIIPDDAQWVIVDRSWEKTWNHPDWKDVSTLAYLLKGTPPPADKRVFNHLKKDPRFVLVYRNITFNQVVFLRAGVDRPVQRSIFDDRRLLPSAP